VRANLLSAWRRQERASRVSKPVKFAAVGARIWRACGSTDMRRGFDDVLQLTRVFVGIDQVARYCPSR
jgi:hypothetical protein